MGSVVVQRGTPAAGVVSALPSGESAVDLVGLPMSTDLAPEATIGQCLSLLDADAFLVLRDGVLVCEEYGTPEAEHTPHPLMSVTKSVVGCLAGMLIADGLLDPDAAASGYVPDLARGGYARATVRDLLDMRTGGDYRETYDDPAGELGRLGQICGWWPRTEPDLPGAVRPWLATIDRPATPGGPFAYRSADTEVLGWVIETITGTALPELVGRRLLSPIGAEADGVFEVDPAGDALASGGLALVPRDVVRLGRLVLDGGAVGEHQVLPSRFLKDTWTGQPDSVAAFHHRVGAAVGQDAPYPPKGLYRNQFWVLEQGRRRLLALGVHGQLLLVDGDARVVVVLLSNWPVPQDPRRFDTGLAVALQVTRAIGEHPEHGLSLHG